MVMGKDKLKRFSEIKTFENVIQPKLDYSSVHHYHRMWLAHTHFPWVDRNRTAPRYALCKAASRDGCKVVLTGDSADELFTGCLLYTSDAADEEDSVDLGGRAHIYTNT